MPGWAGIELMNLLVSHLVVGAELPGNCRARHCVGCQSWFVYELCVTPIRQCWEMSSPSGPVDTPEKSLAEFFADIESGDGPSLTADDHRELVAAVRLDRERPNT